MKIVYLIPQTGYVTELRSDTLWGTLCWGIKHLWGDERLEAFIKKYKEGQPDFIISSAFPYKVHNETYMPFFPNPLVLTSGADDTNMSGQEAYRLRKKLKKVTLLNQDDFQAAIAGNLTAQELMKRLQTENERHTKAVEEKTEYQPLPVTIEKAAPVQHVNSMTHNTIDRLRGGTLTVRRIEDGELRESGQLFHAEDIWWADPNNDGVDNKPTAGLYFLVDGDEAAIMEYLPPVLNLLRHTGVGADRTTGKGTFTFDIQDFKLDEPPVNEANAMLNLSLFRPSQDELEQMDKPAESVCWQYQLERREGFVGGYKERRPKQARMYFKEGSVFKKPTTLKGRRMGCIHQQDFPELPHEVWDNGYGFMVNIKWKPQ